MALVGGARFLPTAFAHAGRWWEVVRARAATREGVPKGAEGPQNLALSQRHLRSVGKFQGECKNQKTHTYAKIFDMLKKPPTHIGVLSHLKKNNIYLFNYCTATVRYYYPFWYQVCAVSF